jgi:hypothetical protein
MKTLTNIDIVEPEQVNRNLNKPDVYSSPGMVRLRMKLELHKARTIKIAECRV